MQANYLGTFSIGIITLIKWKICENVVLSKNKLLYLLKRPGLLTCSTISYIQAIECGVSCAVILPLTLISQISLVKVFFGMLGTWNRSSRRKLLKGVNLVKTNHKNLVETIERRQAGTTTSRFVRIWKCRTFLELLTETRRQLNNIFSIRMFSSELFKLLW